MFKYNIQVPGYGSLHLQTTMLESTYRAKLFLSCPFWSLNPLLDRLSGISLWSRFIIYNTNGSLLHIILLITQSIWSSIQDQPTNWLPLFLYQLKTMDKGIFWPMYLLHLARTPQARECISIIKISACKEIDEAHFSSSPNILGKRTDRSTIFLLRNGIHTCK